jgi:hypothetical protein
MVGLVLQVLQVLQRGQLLTHLVAALAQPKVFLLETLVVTTVVLAVVL